MRYRLVVTPGSGDTFQLAWGNETRELYPYAISFNRVQDASEGVRAVLGQISKHYMDCDIIGADADYTKFLRPLAEAGEELSEAIFPISCTSNIPRNIAERIRNSNPRCPLSIIYEETPLHVPWNFIFRKDSTELKKPVGNLNDFDDFWTNVFRINISFNQVDDFFDDEASDRASCLLQVFHKDQFKAAESRLNVNERDRISRLRRLKVGDSTDWKSCKQKWKSAQDCDSLLYIFAHSDGDTIYLADSAEGKDAIDANGFQNTFKKSPGAKSNSICFINGCRTGAGFLGSGFIGVTSMPGFQGFIGSEAEIWNAFALRYGAEFIDRLCYNQRCVEDIFEEMRTEFYPLSLFYSCFAQPHFRLAPPKEATHELHS
jgi:hypothetical protein